MVLTGTVLLNECYKRLIILWSYRFNFLTETFMIGFLFIGISFFVSGGSPKPEQMAPALLGYLTWVYSAYAIGDMSQGIRDETQTGTLEQMYMSALPSSVLLAGRSVSSLLISSVMVLLVGGIFVLLLGIRIPVRLEGVPVFVLTITGLYGFAFFLGGADPYLQTGGRPEQSAVKHASVSERLLPNRRADADLVGKRRPQPANNAGDRRAAPCGLGRAAPGRGLAGRQPGMVGSTFGLLPPGRLDCLSLE